MNDMTDTTEGSEVSRDGCDDPPQVDWQCWMTPTTRNFRMGTEATARRIL
jgi:hypothetical protein